MGNAKSTTQEPEKVFLLLFYVDHDKKLKVKVDCRDKQAMAKTIKVDDKVHAIYVSEEMPARVFVKRLYTAVDKFWWRSVINDPDLSRDNRLIMWPPSHNSRYYAPTGTTFQVPRPCPAPPYQRPTPF